MVLKRIFAWDTEPLASTDDVATGLQPVPVTKFTPLMIGEEVVFPYAPKVMELLALPEDGTVSCSRHVQPLSNRRESPGLSMVEEFRTGFEAGDHEVIEMVAGLRHLAELVGHNENSQTAA